MAPTGREGVGRSILLPAAPQERAYYGWTSRFPEHRNLVCGFALGGWRNRLLLWLPQRIDFGCGFARRGCRVGRVEF